jgi:rare lipoprotein A
MAHKTLRCGTRVRVCARRCRTARIIDRGPYVGAREFDLTQAFAGAVGFAGVGLIRVRVGG